MQCDLEDTIFDQIHNNFKYFGTFHVCRYDYAAKDQYMLLSLMITETI